MARVLLTDIFYVITEVVEDYVPESDYSSMYTEILRSLQDGGYNIKELYGIDDIVDESIEELLFDEYEDGEEDDF